MHVPKNFSSKKAFTLIELLVVIAIIAILSVVVILTLNPAELLRQSRDSNRLSDLDTLNHAIGLYSTDQSVVSGFSLGSSSVVYVSIPDPTATSTAGDQCQGLGLPILPAISGYVYHCAASSTYRAINGTGWIPINFSSISSGSPLGNLPIDSINQSSSRLYYTYATNGTQYEVAAAMESAKYKLGGSNDAVSTDGGVKMSLAEKGTNLFLEPMDYGDTSLIGYYPMEEGTGTSTSDLSGNGSNAAWSGTQASTNPNGTYYTSAGKIGSYAGFFDGSLDLISSTLSGVVTATGGANTISFWMKPSNTSYVVVNLGTFNYFYSNASCAGINQGGSVYGTIPPSSNQWIYVTMVLYNGNYLNDGSALYYNGSPVTNTCASGSSIATASNAFLAGRYSGNNFSFGGSLDDLRIYNRALSPTEIQDIYNAER